LQSLDELEALAHNHAIDEERLSAAVLRLQQAVGEEPAFESCRNLALALLNLNRSAEALPHLRQAHELNRGDAAVAKALQRLHGRRLILAVDDSLTVRKIVTVTLERLGFRVHSAADGMQALAKLNEETPDLVLLDITMPRMDGYQVCKVIRQNEYTKQIPVVMLSGKDGFFDKVKGRLAGATDYLTKPFQEETLRKAVEKHLRARAV
jgi:twitching motility two-component system response regulator PilG